MTKSTAECLDWLDEIMRGLILCNSATGESPEINKVSAIRTQLIAAQEMAQALNNISNDGIGKGGSPIMMRQTARKALTAWRNAGGGQ